MENTSLTQAQESAQLSAASTEATEVKTASAETNSQPRTAGEVVPAEPKQIEPAEVAVAERQLEEAGPSVPVMGVNGDLAVKSADPSPAASEAPETYSYNRGGSGVEFADSPEMKAHDEKPIAEAIYKLASNGAHEIYQAENKASESQAVDAPSLEERVAALEKALEDLRVVLLHHGIRGPQ